VPFKPDPFLARFEPLRQMRGRPWIGYALAVGGVAVAAATRFAIPTDPAPFVTFYPVIITATLAGSWRAGALATVLSALAADYLFLPPIFAMGLAPADQVTMLMFVLVCALLVGLVWLLNTAVDRLWALAQNISLVLETEPAGVIAVDENGLIVMVNKTAEEQFGYGRDELYGEPLEMLVPEDVREKHLALRRDYLTNASTRAMGAGRDLQGRRKDGSAMPIEVGLNPFEREGMKGALATILDISERKAADRRQEILTNEIRHRGRNLLTVVQAVARRLLSADRPLAEARTELLGSLQALARAQDLFLETGAASLRSLVELELAPFREQVRIGDVDIDLTPHAAQDFALIVHELATNALKYGALSTPAGRVAIDCHKDRELLTMTWVESGGQAVRKPERVGFGHTILKEVPSRFGRATLDFEVDGFRYELIADLSEITSSVVDLAAHRLATQGGPPT
jgi:PAS domain S-box-containing protein